MSDPSALPSIAFQKAHTLRNRTFIGLLTAQFLAAFNDQAIHASAMFFAINRKALPEATAISLMPILFFAPWAMFPTLAGYFADKYSKRDSLVFWKFAEVGITTLALIGFILGSELNLPNLGSWIVLCTVFMMGTHSTFFVPAKYGAMPEILEAELLSRGNGILESLSFLATILGTVMGGVLSFYFNTDEYIIGLILTFLAIVGALASLMIQRMPPANATRKFMNMPWGYFEPLVEDLRALTRSRPLLFALVGIAFFTFMLAFMRAAVYMFGESRIPRWNERQTSELVGMTALGIGLGSPLAGWLSGKKVELGLIPIGAVGMILLICMAAVFLDITQVLIILIVLIGFFTGFYLVPMFTQLQHRAPKDRKGEVISTSNCVNVLGAILASMLSFFLVWAAHITRLAPLIEQQDVYVARTLTALQTDEHHRPAFFQIESEPGIGNDIGEAPRPKDVPDIWQLEDEDPRYNDAQILLSQKVIVDWEKAEESRKQGKEPETIVVTVSRYMVRGVGKQIPHYYLRLASEPQPKLHDDRELPRYLFLGAGAMTLGVLLILTWLLPDLWRRSLWMWQSLGRTRISVYGILNLPGHGAVLLVTNAATIGSRKNVCWASDRQVHFSHGNNVDEMLRLLGHGDVVAVAVTDADVADFDKIHSQLKPDVVILPVHASHTEIKFGRPLASSATPDEVRAAISLAAESQEH